MVECRTRGNARDCDRSEAADADQLRFSFRFSPEWKAPLDLADIEVDIGAKSVAVMKEAASELRGKPEPVPALIQGPVHLLLSTGNPADLEHPTGSRDIAILWDGEFGVVRVRVRLDPPSYLAAYAAHGSGRSIAVTGLLERRPGGWTLCNPTGLTVVP